jgi:hypothetical protein
MYPRFKGHVVLHIRRLLASFIMEDSRGTIYLNQCCDVPALGNIAGALIPWSAWMRRSKELLRSPRGLNLGPQHGRWSPDVGVSNQKPPGRLSPDIGVSNPGPPIRWSLLAM